jgi:hypothetical protein
MVGWDESLSALFFSFFFFFFFYFFSGIFLPICTPQKKNVLTTSTNDFILKMT